MHVAGAVRSAETQCHVIVPVEEVLQTVNLPVWCVRCYLCPKKGKLLRVQASVVVQRLLME